MADGKECAADRLGAARAKDLRGGWRYVGLWVWNVGGVTVWCRVTIDAEAALSYGFDVAV